MATNKVDDGRLVRIPERRHCRDCVWYRAVTDTVGICRQAEVPMHTKAVDSCAEWLSHSQLKDRMGAINKAAKEAQATLDFGAGPVPEEERLQGIGGLDALTERTFADLQAAGDEEHKMLEADTMGRVMAAGFQGELGEATRE